MNVNPYLNFDGDAEEAFKFYRSVYGGEFSSNLKMKEAPGSEAFTDAEQNRTLHIGLPIGRGIILMASDIVPSAGRTLKKGNGMYISIHPESREEAGRLFTGLSEGGRIEMPMEDQFWGDYFGSLEDQFGVHWMSISMRSKPPDLKININWRHSPAGVCMPIKVPGTNYK